MHRLQALRRGRQKHISLTVQDERRAAQGTKSRDPIATPAAATCRAARVGDTVGHGRNGAYQGTSGPFGVTSLSPTIPTTISEMQHSRATVAGSLNRTMPSSAVPIVPMPVQTA